MLLADPVVIPCGKFICKTHLDSLMTNKSNDKGNFICEICQEQHLVPKNGFMVNNRLQDLLKVEINDLKFDDPIFDECKLEVEEAKENMSKVQELEKKTEMYIYDYFEDIKREIDLRREGLKQKIDDYSDKMIKSLEVNQMNYIKLSKEVNQMTVNIEKSKKELNELITRFDTLIFNDKKFQEIKTSVAVVNEKLHRILAEYQNSLVGNKKYSFHFNELSIEEIFGCVTDFQVNLNGLFIILKILFYFFYFSI
jgi:hypothetical protein